MQTSQILENTTPDSEKQAYFGRKDTKINTRSLPPEAITWYPAGGLVAKKSAFLVIFLLTLFETMLK